MRTLVLSLTLSLLAAGGPQRVATQDVAPVPRTPWGDPDLQGLWNYSTNTFLQRHPDHADREWLTEEEIAAANLEWSTFATSERRSELTPEYDLSLNFNQVWWDLGNSTGRTSLITDPERHGDRGYVLHQTCSRTQSGHQPSELLEQRGV